MPVGSSNLPTPTRKGNKVKPVINFAMLDGRSEGLIFLEFHTGETGQRKHFPNGWKDKENFTLVDYPKVRMGMGSVHNQKVRRELETELLKRMDVVLKGLRTEYEEKFEDDDGSNKELCPEEDMPDWPGAEYYHLYYT